MANPKLDVDVRGNTKPLERQLNKVKSKGVGLNLESKNFSAPLGKIKGELGEFDKSLAASNARVLAFGASAGAIFAIQRALSETVAATIQVEKALAEVNVILGTSTKKLNAFGNELFGIAKKTGRSFSDVALAAGELARQGLAMEETLKRTADAMTLARLSGLGVEASVNAITAALNGFRNAALSSTAVIDKIIAVDQAFAVSGADLAEALRRVGSTAEGAGVSLDELLGIVTAAQQITARGGAVIGNSFKTIFTRIQRPRVLKALDELGVKTKNAAGASLNATQVLKNLASTFDTLGESQQAQIAELVGGVFQINVLKASLRDLGSQYSVFANATDISSKSSGEAARRNAELNKTLSAGLNETLQNLTKLAAGIGKLTLEPAIKNVLDIVNAITEKLSLGEAEGAGQKVGKALLGGLGKFLSGPGLALAAVALFQLFNNLRKFAVDALRTFTGLNATFKQQQQLQQGILNILNQNPKLLAQIQRGELSVEAAAEQILGTYKKMNTELMSANNLAGQLASKMMKTGAGVGKVAGTQTITQRKASGYIPNFADGGEVAAMALSGMYTKSQMANPQTRRGRIHDGQGGSFMASYNGHEKKRDVIGPNGKKGTIISSPEMQKALARGFIPNFVAKLNANSSLKEIQNSNRASDLRGIANSPKAGMAAKKAAAEKRLKTLGKRENRRINLRGELGFIASQQGGGGIEFSNKQAETRKFLGLRGKFKKGDPFVTARPTNMPVFTPKNLRADGKIDEGVAAGLRQPIAQAILDTSRKLFSPMEKELPNAKRVEKYLNSGAGKEKLALTAGNIFEDAINAGLNLKDKSAGRRWDYVKSDFKGKGKMLAALVGDQNKTELKQLQALEAKLNFPPSNIAETRAKFFDKSAGGTAQRAIKAAFADVIPRKKAGGFIPNFANPLGAAVKRENQAGVTKGAIRIGQDRRLATGANPYGLAVTNTRDEPRGIKDVLANGFIPNFIKPPAMKVKPGPRSQRGMADAPKDEKDASGALFGAMMAASLVTNTFAASTEDTTGASRKLTEGMNAAMNGAMAMATATMLLPGPLGMMVGAVLGVGVALASYKNALGYATQAQLKNLEALDTETVRLQELGNAIQGTQQALSAYEAAIDSNDVKQIQAAQKKYTKSLEKLSLLDKEMGTKVVGQGSRKDQARVLGEAAGKTAQKLQLSSEAKQKQDQIIANTNAAGKEATMKKVLAGILTLGGIGAAIKLGLATSTAMSTMAAGGTGASATTVMLARFGGFFVETMLPAAKTAGASLLKLAGIAVVVMGVLEGAGKLTEWAFGQAAKATKLAAEVFPKFQYGLTFASVVLEDLGYAGKVVKETFGLISGFKGFFDSREGREEVEAQTRSKYNKDFSMGDGFFENIPGIGKLLSKVGIGSGGVANTKTFDAQGKKQFDADAQDILKRIDPSKRTDENMRKLRKASTTGDTQAEREKNVIKVLTELGVSAKEAAPFIEGAGAALNPLVVEVNALDKKAKAAAASTARLQAAVDAANRAQVAAAAAIQGTNQRANDFAKMMRTFAQSIQEGRKQAAKFSREYSMEVLKGGAKLASQFSTSFQNTRREGGVKKAEINSKAGLASQKIREEGSKKLFEAISKQKGLADLFKKVDAGGDGLGPAQIQFANTLRDLPNALAGQGAGGLLNGVLQQVNAATAQGGAMAGEKINFDGMDIGSILMEQTRKMAEAERTRIQQLRLTELQTSLQQQQNKIDQQAKAGGGIQAFLDSESLNKMEGGFNTAVNDFITATNRGDTVKTGQAAGNLLGNLNEFVGADLMGPAADKLKDLVQGGLEKSMKGRAFARADVLDDAAAKTGDSSLTELADTLRNQNFAEIAATQTALEFKRQKMPANIENMLSVQRSLEQLQRTDNQANLNTATNTLRMADFLSKGGFSSAMGAVIGGMPPPVVGGLATIGPQMAQAALAMSGAAAALQNAGTIQMQGDRLGVLGDKKKEQEIALEQFVLKAQEDKVMDPAEMAKIQAMITGIARTNQQMGTLVTAMGPGASAAMGSEFVNEVLQEQLGNQFSGLLGGQNFDASQMNATDVANLPPIVQNALEAIQRSMAHAQANPGVDATGNVIGGNTGLVGSVAGFKADGQISRGERTAAQMQIGASRATVGDTLREDGVGAAKDMINNLIRAAQVDARAGRGGGADVQALEIEALQTMLSRLEAQGSLSTETNAEFFNQLIDRINQTSQLNGTFVINVPNTLTGQVETFTIKEQIQTLREDLQAAFPAVTIGAGMAAGQPNPSNHPPPGSMN